MLFWYVILSLYLYLIYVRLFCGCENFIFFIFQFTQISCYARMFSYSSERWMLWEGFSSWERAVKEERKFLDLFCLFFFGGGMVVHVHIKFYFISFSPFSLSFLPHSSSSSYSRRCCYIYWRSFSFVCLYSSLLLRTSISWHRVRNCVRIHLDSCMSQNVGGKGRNEKFYIKYHRLFLATYTQTTDTCEMDMDGKRF